MLATLPYDEGWTVKVDGKRVKTYAIDQAPADDEEEVEGGALLGFDIPAGEHKVTMSFTPKGFVPGVLLSVISLALIIAVALFTDRLNGKLSNTRYAWMVSDRDLDPGDPYLLPERELPIEAEEVPQQ